ncbi:hypothetical protein GWK47_043877 [Chionoecetes opilio]|uniref:Endonuclease/exonuclease/phosphatase domain-containing protein n=1 Tax=Chionoecetes opilio TaxID=41210 RepID=A0A8J5CYG0_CHIOP|nr:hypothetical protein GWK47_043877 [Chionoecetes opilio]
MQPTNRDHLSIISANVRGLQTSIGDLIHSHVIPHTPDVVATVETFLNGTSPWQGREPIDFLHTHLDRLLQQYSCNHTVIVGDLNQHLAARAFEELLTVYGLTNHVTFPTHISGSSLDPVISDLPEGVITCRPLGAVGSSDHLAVLSTIHVAGLRDVPKKRTNWLWGKTNWEGLQDALRHTPWNNILTGDVDTQVRSFTSTIHSLQRRYVPTHTFTVKPLDQPWFGYNCRVAADEKSRAWRRFRRHPTHNNKQRHKEACVNMQRVQRVAQQRWQDELKFKLSDRSVGSKSWWTALKEQQGFAPDNHIPPLNKADGSVATRSCEKAEVLAAHFSGKMTVSDPDRLPPAVARLTNATLDTITLTTEDPTVNILGVEVNSTLSFTSHVRKTASRPQAG